MARVVITQRRHRARYPALGYFGLEPLVRSKLVVKLNETYHPENRSAVWPDTPGGPAISSSSASPAGGERRSRAAETDRCSTGGPHGRGRAGGR